jgi:ribosome maturation factor RimP
MPGDIETTVAEMLTPFLQTDGFELVAVETAGSRKNQTLRLLIHKAGGLSVSDCKAVDDAVRPILEVHQILDGYKQLEIASPGVDRPLKTAADFQRNLGRTVQIETTSHNGQVFEVEGQVLEVVDASVVLEQTSGKTVHIEISRICKGYIQLVW